MTMLKADQRRVEGESENVDRFVIYLAVVPSYRQECIKALRERLGTDLKIFTSPSHLDSSVKTGIPAEFYQPVRISRIGKVAFVQIGHWREALAAQSTLLDLNPRSITAWVILLLRKSLGKRTVLWGHLHGRGGPSARSAPLRRFMRGLADGFVAYTYQSREEAEEQSPQPVWVAPNSLYSVAQLSMPEPDRGQRADLVYVGRFEDQKKVRLAVEAFSRFATKQPEPRLVLVGGGSKEQDLRRLALELGVGTRVEFAGWIDSFEELHEIYASAFASLSPGFIGLGLTQSLGFGVPMIASRNEPHSPEVELAATGGVCWFETDSAESLASEMAKQFDRSREHGVPYRELNTHIRGFYSADAMAAGIAAALLGENAERGEQR